LDRSASEIEIGDTLAKLETTNGNSIVSEEKWGIVKYVVDSTIYVDKLPNVWSLRATHTIRNKRTGSNYTVAERIGTGVNNKLGVIMSN
jgi:hypothetical protein